MQAASAVNVGRAVFFKETSCGTKPSATASAVFFKKAYIRLCVVVSAAILALGTPMRNVAAQDLSGDWYYDKPIREIVFTGLKNVPASDLEGIIAPYKNKPYTDTLVSELMGNLYSSEFFTFVDPNISPYDDAGSAVRIEFTIEERAVIGRIQFVGNSKVRRLDLTTAISLKVHDIADPLKIEAAEQAIFDTYVSKGFPNIRVRSTLDDNGDGTVTVVFTIIEGLRISIGAFEFVGNSAFTERTLRSQLVSKTKGIIRDGAFSESKLLEDQQALIKYYRDRGYMDIQITVGRTTERDDKGDETLILTFNITEGSVYRFGGITFTGNNIFSTEELSKLVRSKRGEVVNGTRLDLDIERVRDQYYENGYIFNNIMVDEVRDDDMFSCDIFISEQGRAHIENLTIIGARKTKEHVILREIPLESGDVFSRAKVMEAMTNLYNLQYFSSVVPDMQQGSQENLMDLIFQVEEQSTMDFQFGLTFSGTTDPGTFPLSARIAWNDRNLLGSGNAFGLEVNAATDIQSLSVNYTQNYLFNTPMSLGFDFLVSHATRQGAIDNLAPFFNGDEEYAYPDGFDSYGDFYYASQYPSDEYLMEYDQWRLSLGLSSGYRWPLIVGDVALGALSLSGGLRFGIVRNSFDGDAFRPFDPTIRNRNKRWTPANSLWLALSLDKRDIYYDPTSGYYINQRFGYYGLLPMEPEHYTTSDTKAEIFFTPVDIPVGDKWAFRMTFGFHTGLSFIFPGFTGGRPQVENVNKLAIDGMFNARGWSDEYSNKGFALWENWAELRIPLIMRVLALDFFFDAAVVRPDWKTFWKGTDMLDSMRFSIGFGPRFSMAQLPLRLLLAWRFTSKGWVTKGAPDVVLSFTVAHY